jgi:hypothetical protein
MVFLSKSNKMVNIMKKVNFILLLLIGLFQLNSCENSTKVDDNAKISKVLKYEIMLQDAQSLVINSATNKVLKSKTDEQQFFADNNINSETKQSFISTTGLDRVDYDREMVILISTGKIQGKKSYITIDEVKLTDNKIFVSAIKYISSTTDNKEYYPIQIIKLNKLSSEIVFSPIKEVILNDDNQDREIPFSIILKGSRTVMAGQRFFTIKSKEEETIYTDTVYTGKSDGYGNPIKLSLPETDYSKNMLVIMQYGPTSSGSNELNISKIKLFQSKIRVSSQLTIPSIGTDDIGYPIVIAKIEKLDNEVVFEETEIINIVDSTEESTILTGTKWEFTGFVDNLGNYIDVNVLSSIRPQDVTLDFSSSSFTGKSNCNYISGNYSISKNTINISNFATTKVNCAWSDRINTSLKAAYEVYLIKPDNLEQPGLRLLIKTSNPELPLMYFDPVE